uniref:Alpha-insect toxin Bot14 n=1 Tax=Buthus occitanus tunetanus TaxID=6871 RepID=SCXE_BUTOC|nr:RecName: Full=Alpha-insect toxin Bot14; AltName: Full=BotXIV; AltName: Full=Neurotoxin XIV; Flags: Precursor [Buthus occitanus tunetanus]CAA63120.1 alpha toxin XIV [Buthus occitanus tunetanus]
MSSLMISTAMKGKAPYRQVRDGYIAQPHNCAYHCLKISSGCDTLCKENGATSGHCGHKSGHGSACWCKDLPDKVGIIVHGEKCHR